MNRCIPIILLLAGCAASAVPEPPPQPPQPVEQPVVHVRRPAAPVAVAPSGDAVSALSPSDILVAADQARADATGYVAWKQSKPANIDRLTTLTLALNAAVSKMRAGKVVGKYQAVDVLAAKSALRELRTFLSTKGD